MARKLPPNFDPQRYLESYPDVGMSGLTPQEHYLRFGNTLKRSPVGGVAPTTPRKAKSDPAPAAPVIPEPQSTPQATAEPTPAMPIIERPAGFDSGKLVPSPAPFKAGRSPGEPLSIEALSAGPFGSSEESKRIRVPLLAYEAMVSRNTPAAREDDLCGATDFRDGSTRIENAWFADATTLRLMLTVADADESDTVGWSIRAYQADAAAPTQLKMAGTGVQLPPLGPVFYDIALVHPLMPLLLELSDADDNVRAIALLPFPSLLPGGLHCAELKSHQADFNPMDAFWTESEALLGGLVGQPPSASRSIAGISTRGEVGTGPLTSDVQQWLLAVFGLSLSTAGQKQNPKGLTLVLPSDSIPTVGALVSRTIAVSKKDCVVGPFLVSEAVTLRPRWSVSLPQDIRPEASLPAVLPAADRKGRQAVEAEDVPVHLAIAFREAERTFGILGAESRAWTSAQPAPLTVVLEATDPALTESLVSVLSELAPSGIEFVVRFPESNSEIADVLDRCCGALGWTRAGGANLRELARNARYETLLTASDRVRLEHPRAVVELCSLLNSDSAVASASCMLLSETVVKKKAVLQPASAGLFPARVSFAASPRLAFYQPDVRDALPDMTYPVVANTMLLTVWRSSAVGALSDPDYPVPPAAADIRLGLDLLEVGYRNLCSSRFSVNIVGPYVRRDAIDPAGARYAEPRRWADLLTRVALVQELF